MRKISEPTERLVPDRCREALYNEMMTALGRIAEEHMHLPAFRFFVDITRSWQEKMCGEMEKPLVVVAGTGIPDELLRAAGGVPSYILGGSREGCGYISGNRYLRRDNNGFFTIGSYISDFYKPGIT